MLESNLDGGALWSALRARPVQQRPTRWNVRWLLSGNCNADPSQLLERWRQFAQASSQGVFLMPQIACLPHETSAAPLVYATWKDPQTLRSLAILSARNMPVSLLPRWQISLAARRVVGAAIVGDNSPEAIRAFVDALAGLVGRRECDCIVLNDVEDPSPLRQAFMEAPKRHAVFCTVPTEAQVHRWIRFSSNPADYWSKFSKKSRYNFRWRAKHLDHEIRCIRDPAEIPAFTRSVCELASQTWQHKRLGFTIDPQLKGQLWYELARLGAFRSYLLTQRDRAIAYALGVQWKGLFRYEETGYDPAFAAKSPGQVLLYRIVEDLIARDTPELLDFGFGDNEYKRIYGNYETLTGPLVLSRRSLRLMSVLRASQFRSTIGKQARAAAFRLGALSRLRHLARGHHARAQSEESPETSSDRTV